MDWKISELSQKDLWDNNKMYKTYLFGVIKIERREYTAQNFFK